MSPQSAGTRRVNEPNVPQQAGTLPARSSGSNSDAEPIVAAASAGFLDRIKHHKVVQWTLAYAALAYTLLHGAEMLGSSLGWSHGLIRFFTIVLLLGAPIVATVAWYHGHRGQQKVTASEFMIIALLLALGAAFLWRDTQSNAHDGNAGTNQGSDVAATDSATTSPAPSPSPSSIAVLAFTDLSAEGNQGYFSDGISEEILNALAHVEGLKVASRTSSFQFRKSDLGIPAIAQRLGVRHVLEGSVRKAGDTVRITTQLIDAATDQHLWSQTFDRPLTTANLFAIQDEIAEAIVRALREKIGAEVGAAVRAPVPTANVGAYELYLKARALFQARRELNAADRLLDEAIRIDARFADALATRAALYQFGGEYGGDFGNAREAREKGRAFAKQALAINDSNALGLAVTALIHLYDHMEGIGTEDYDAIFNAFDRAIALEPNNSNALNWQGIAYGFVGNNARAAEVHRRCISVDPALAACGSNLAIELLSLGRSDEASAVIDAAAETGALTQSPTVMILLAGLKRRDAFVYSSINVPTLRGWRKFGALYDALSGTRSDQRALAAELKKFFDDNAAPPRVYAYLNALGDFRRPLVLTVHWVPSMRSYRQSLEFKAHVRASRLPEYWRKHGFPPQCKPLGASDFECN
jgi:TolB-like protein/Tfp pilus assembly protein PilF